MFESPLTGVAIDLPAPFAKTAAESAPFRLERTVTAASPRRETVALARHRPERRGEVQYEGGKVIVERAGVGIGDVGVPVPERPGVFIAGNLKALDFDRLLAAATDGGEKTGSAEFNVTRSACVQGRSSPSAGSSTTCRCARSSMDGAPGARTSPRANSRARSPGARRGRGRARLKHLIQPERAPGASAKDDVANELPAPRSPPTATRSTGTSSDGWS